MNKGAELIATWERVEGFRRMARLYLVHFLVSASWGPWF